MVSGRRQELLRNQSSGHGEHQHSDLESGNGFNNKPAPRQRFRDAIDATISKSRAQELKKALLDNVDHEALEKFRKSDDQVGGLNAHTI
jgi:hypothetical protein